MGDIFLSYRRDDTRSATGRLADRLRASFGNERVFHDLQSIDGGDDFEAALQRAIGGARVVLAVIGPRWLNAVGATGQRRLDDPRDMVRLECEAALAMGVPLIPVLVEGAKMPSSDQLPPSLAAFARRQAVELSEAHWAIDTSKLVDLLHRVHSVEPSAAADAPAQPLRSHALAALPFDLIELLAAPKRLILSLAGQGGSRGLGRATLILVACLLIGSLSSGVAMPMSLGMWIFNGMLLGLIIASAWVGLVTLSWRIAGARSDWRRTAAGAVCIFSGAWLYSNVAMLIITVGIVFDNPELLQRSMALALAGATMSDALNQAGMQIGSSLLSAVVIGAIPLVGGMIWTAVAWNGLRLSLTARWPTAIAAAAITIALPWGLIAIARWAASLA